MKKAEARAVFEKALKEGIPEWAKDLDPAKTWRELDEQAFLKEYCETVFVSNFKVSIVKSKFPELAKVFKGFSPDALARMKPISRDKLPIRHKGKADGFLKGAQCVHKEGWKKFKKRLKKDGMDVLKELPWVSDTNKHNIAKNIGLEDTAKPDVHLKQCADECSTNVVSLVAFLGREYKLTQYQVDAVLWEYKQKLVGKAHRPTSTAR